MNTNCDFTSLSRLLKKENQSKVTAGLRSRSNYIVDRLRAGCIFIESKKWTCTYIVYEIIVLYYNL